MDRLRFAMIGCGKVAAKHLKAALYQANKKHSIEIVALADSLSEAPDRLMTTCNMKKRARAAVAVYQDYTQMLAESAPDIVAITTPSGSHAAMGMAAIQAGCHILLEKPLTLSLAEAEQLLEAAAHKGVQIAVGHIYRFFPMVQDLQADLSAGRFGKILYGDVKVRWGHDQSYYDQSAWRGTWAHDGGALMNQSIHALDLMIWLLGQKPVAISGHIDRQLHRMQAEDIGFATLQLQDGVWCQLEGTTNTDPTRPEASFFIRCTKGEIRGGILAGRPWMQIRNENAKPISGAYLRRSLRTQWKYGGLAALRQLGNPHSGLYADWIDAIQNNRPPIADGIGGRNALEMVLGIYQSALLNRTVSLPLRDFRLEDMTMFFKS